LGESGGKTADNILIGIEEFLPSIYIMAGRRYDPGYSALSFSLFRGRLLEFASFRDLIQDNKKPAVFGT
jgi:hypothetical protein